MDNSEAFENQPVGRLLWKLAIPSIFAQTINLLYSVVDRIFLGKIPGVGTLVLAGLGITAPIITIITAFSFLVGNGGGPLAAIALGQKRKEDAEKILGNCVVMLVAISVILTGVLLVYGKTLLRFLGADQDTFPYANAYLRIYVLGTIFVMLSLGLNPFLITQGYNKISMRNTCIGAVTNLILDPILIYGFHMGIMGAAIATIISQGISAVLIIQFLLGKQKKLRLYLVKPEFKVMRKIAGLGVSTFFMNITEGLVQTVFYQQLLVYGNSSYVAAMSIMYSINQFIFMPINGIGQGAQPIISHSFGAGNAERLKKITRMLVGITVMVSVVAVTVIEWIPGALFGIFTSDEFVISIGIPGIRLFVLGRLVTGVQLGLQEMFRSIGYGKTAMYNAAVRKLVLIIPLAYILPRLWGLGTTGVFLAECASDILATINTIVVYLIMKKGIYHRVQINRERRNNDYESCID